MLFINKINSIEYLIMHACHALLNIILDYKCSECITTGKSSCEYS